MAVDMFIKIGDVKGEAQDSKHKGEIDVLSWSWGMTQSGTAHMGAGGGSGKVNVQDLTFTKYVDSSSAKLMMACCNGKHYADALLTVRKAGEKPVEYREDQADGSARYLGFHRRIRRRGSADGECRAELRQGGGGLHAPEAGWKP